MSRQEVKHPQIWIEERGHTVDRLALGDLNLLWRHGINTFYSCQGGIDYIDKKDDKVWYCRAYVMVHFRDMLKTCRLLQDREPLVDPNLNDIINPGLLSVRFTPVEEARGGISVKKYQTMVGMQTTKIPKGMK